jgi:serine/threonine-protein kinase
LAKIGEVIEGKYEILKQIGKGGMSIVYLAMDRRLNKQWAIKEVRRKGTDPRLNEVIINSAIVEAHMIKALDHYHIPHINDILEYDDYIYVVMDYIEGEPLSEILKTEGPQSEKQVIKWGKQLTDALNYLHTRQPSIIYRDMKPSNVMIKPDGDIKLIDFGIARVYKEQNLADTTVLGTVGYAPPEQFGGGQTDARADIFALGATLYHAVTGHGPVKGEAFIIQPIRNINPSLSGGFEKIILKCTQQDSGERYQSCTELMYDLEHYREIDDAFLSKQKAKLRIFAVVLGLAVICGAVGLLGQSMRIHTNNVNYDQNLVWAQNAADQPSKIAFYQKMADIKPTEQEPYIGMIDTYKSDTTFSLDEEEQLLGMLTANLSALRKEPFYPQLAFEMGRLYWYYYVYGSSEGVADESNQSTRMKSAVRWFKDVMDYGGESEENYKIAKIYHDIGVFNENINLAITEASDSGMYLPYWESVRELLDAIADDAGNSEIVNLTVDSLALDSIGTYARKFKGDGVSESDMRAVYEDALQNAENVSTTTDKTEDMKASVLKQGKAALEAITNAYREDERGLQY